MKQLFINSFLNKDYQSLAIKLELVMIIWVLVLIAIAIDLISGLRKASQLGELHTSYGFRRTVSKMVQYYCLMFFAFMFDVLSSPVLPVPYFSILAGFFLIFIEAKSVLEKAQDKHRRKMKESIQDLIVLIENKDDLVKGVVEILKNSENKKEKEEKENDTN